MRPPTVVNQPPINLLLQHLEEDEASHRLGEVFQVVHRFSSSYLERLHRGDVPTNKLDIITDGHILDLHVTAQQKGCTPSDVASAERTESAGKTLTPSTLRKNFCPDCVRLSNGTVHYVTQDHNGLTCEQYRLHLLLHDLFICLRVKKERVEGCTEAKTRREREREEKYLAREAEWQRELATWPPFVPHKPIDAQQPPLLGDYLAAVNLRATASPRTCTHPNLREFTFSTGETIKMCPNCTTFDEHRIKVLKTGSIPKVKDLRWEEKLEAEGLSPIALIPRKQTPLEVIEAAQTGDQGKASPHKNNDRASRIRKEVKPNTEAQRHCAGCGLLFVPNHASRKHCSDSCRKQHHKQIKRSERNGDSTTQSTINRSTNHEQ